MTAVSSFSTFANRRIVIGVLLVILLLSLFQFRDNEHLRSFTSNLPSDFGYKVGPLFGGSTSNSGSIKVSNRANENTLDIVVTMYKEPLDQTKREINELMALKPFKGMNMTVFVYTKDPDADVEKLKEHFETPHVTRLSNVGREAGTYFHHIIAQWDDLPKHTMFVQAEMHEYDHALNKVRDYYDQDETGFLTLGLIERCDCVSCKDPWDSERTYPRLEELYSALNGDFCPKALGITYFGQFIVSARRIRQRSKNTYTYLKQILESGDQHWIHKDPRQDEFKDEVSNPYFGHTLERSWMILFDCDDMELAERCGGWDRLRHRRHHDQPLDQCQCLDPKINDPKTETGDSYRKAINWIKGFRKIKDAESKSATGSSESKRRLEK